MVKILEGGILVNKTNSKEGDHKYFIVLSETFKCVKIMKEIIRLNCDR